MMSLHNEFTDSPWRHVYSYARMLISTDKYGAIGKDQKLLSSIATLLFDVLGKQSLDNKQKHAVALKTLESIFNQRFSRLTTKTARVQLFLNDIKTMLKTFDDVISFLFTITHIVMPITFALRNIPNNDSDFAQEKARNYLDALGQTGLSTVVGLWDDLGTQGCLDAERYQVVQEYIVLSDIIINRYPTITKIEDAMIKTAFVQEFERRLSQKRKGRAGGSLEDAVSFIFEYYNIQSSSAPEHFQTDLEVDKWFRCSDGWLIGISCKRTLRERWKQISAADRGVLSRYKVKEVWHIVTYDEDLSDDKITMLGPQNHVFYLPDESRRYGEVKTHMGMKDYVRPMSGLITDIKREQKK